MNISDFVPVRHDAVQRVERVCRHVVVGAGQHDVHFEVARAIPQHVDKEDILWALRVVKNKHTVALQTD